MYTPVKAPYYLGPPVPNLNCLVMGADGVVREQACDAPVPVKTIAPVVAPAVTAAAVAPGETNWLLIGVIALGIYLLTKG